MSHGLSFCIYIAHYTHTSARMLAHTHTHSFHFTWNSNPILKTQ